MWKIATKLDLLYKTSFTNTSTSTQNMKATFKQLFATYLIVVLLENVVYEIGFFLPDICKPCKLCKLFGRSLR